MRDFTDEINLSLRGGGGDEGSGGGGAPSTFHPSLKYSGNYLAATHFIQLIFLGFVFPRDPVFECTILGATCVGVCSSHSVISF